MVLHSSVAGDITANGNIQGDGSTNISSINDITAGGDLTIDGVSDLDELTVAGVSTFSADLDVNASVDVSTDLTVSGDVSIADKIVHTGDTNTAIRFPAADTFTIETTGSERFRIDSDSKILVGIKTARENLANNVSGVALKSK